MTFITNLSVDPNGGKLHQIGFKYKTDKCTMKCFCCPVRKSCPRKKSYLFHYEQYFKKKRENTSILEIGVRDGASLRVWNEYFDKTSKIVGIDINPKSQRKIADNVSIEIGDATNDNTFERIKKYGKFDYILDDGSHRFNDIIKTFDMFQKLLTPKGVYIVEDLATMKRLSGVGTEALKPVFLNH